MYYQLLVSATVEFLPSHACYQGRDKAIWQTWLFQFAYCQLSIFVWEFPFSLSHWVYISQLIKICAMLFMMSSTSVFGKMPQTFTWLAYWRHGIPRDCKWSTMTLQVVSLSRQSKSEQNWTENNRSWLSTCGQVIKPWLLKIATLQRNWM